MPRKAVRAVSARIIGVADLDSNFRLDLKNGQKATSTGYLEIAELISEEKEFRLRWDEKNSKIDIDMRCKDSKKWSSSGFEGHHSDQISDPPNRKYLIDLSTHNHRVFKGIIEVVIATENRIEKSLQYMIKR